MPHYERLAEEHRHLRRSVADALDVLHTCAGFTERDRAVICIGRFQLPSRDIVGAIQILFEHPLHAKVYVVSLPTATQFKALLSGRSKRSRFDIARLDRAVVDGTGKVTLSDGTHLRSVEVIPTYMPLEPSELDWRIVHQAISLIGVQKSCYRSLKHGLPIEFKKTVPDLRFLDCSALRSLPLPMFKIIAGLIQSKYSLADVPPSQQQIANSLRKFGIRVPKPRPRKRARRVSAII